MPSLRWAQRPHWRRPAPHWFNRWTNLGATITRKCCRTWAAAAQPSAASRSARSQPFTGTRGPATPLGTRIFINHGVLAYFGAGENPRATYQVFSDSMSGGALMMLTGYYVNAP